MVDKMIYHKEWYKSKAIWGSASALLIAILSAMFGEFSMSVQLSIALASALGLYGRIKAKEIVK